MTGALAALGFWGWRWSHPSAQQAIRRRLTEFARAASIAPNESQIARLANAQKLTAFFTPDVEVMVDIPFHSRQVWNGIDEVREAALGAEASVSALKVEFPDLDVTLGPDHKTAFVDLTAKGMVPGEKDIYVQELKLSLKKIGSDWLIKKVETVKTLR